MILNIFLIYKFDFYGSDFAKSNIDIKNLIFFNSILVKWCNEIFKTYKKYYFIFFIFQPIFLKYILQETNFKK